MTLNERLLDFLDGGLAADDEAELLHTLSVSPEKREMLRSFMNGQALLARDRMALQVPYATESALWAKLDAVLPLAPVAEEVTTLVAPVGSFSRFFSGATAAIGTIALLIGLGTGYVAGHNNSGSKPSAMVATRPSTTVQQETVVFNSTPSYQACVITPVQNIAPIESTSIVEVLPAEIQPQSNARADQPIPIIAGREEPPVVFNRIGGDGGNRPVLLGDVPKDAPRTFLQRFEFAIDESFGRQFPNSIATNVSLPLVTNSSIGAYFQVLPRSHALWIGAAYGTANVTRKTLFTRGGDPRDPLQEVLASDTVHAQTSYLASYLQLRLPAFPSTDVTFTAGYGFATLGQMLMGEVGMHYDVSSEVGVNVGLRVQRFSYDLTAEKDAALRSGTGSLVVPSGVASASPSFNTELTTGLFFHF